jgi:hypothetical protein
MSASAIELALRKQRLLFRSVELRERWAADAAAFKPLCAGVDRVRDAGVWLRRHPELVAGIAVALLVARPRAAFRWLRRSVSVLLFWRRLRKRLATGWLGD